MKKRTETMTNTFFAENPAFAPIRERIAEALEILTAAFAGGGKLLVCGNGGSCADSDHIVGELMKGFLLRRPLPRELREAFREKFGEDGERIAQGLQEGLPAISLGAHGALFTAFSNDCDPALVYAQQTLAYACKGDVLLGISTSGNAENVRAAMITARVRGVRCIALTGRDGGKIAPLADCAVIAPERETYRIQECHLVIYHYLCAAVESEFYQE